MPTIQDTRFIIKFNDNPKEIKADNVNLDDEPIIIGGRLIGVINRYIEFDYQGSNFKIPLHDYFLDRDNESVVIYIDTDPDLEKRIIEFVN